MLNIKAITLPDGRLHCLHPYVSGPDPVAPGEDYVISLNGQFTMCELKEILRHWQNSPELKETRGKAT